MHPMRVVTQEPVLATQHHKDKIVTIPQELVASTTWEQPKVGTKGRDVTQEPSLDWTKNMKKIVEAPQKPTTRMTRLTSTLDSLKNIIAQIM